VKNTAGDFKQLKLVAEHTNDLPPAVIIQRFRGRHWSACVTRAASRCPPSRGGCNWDQWGWRDCNQRCDV